jgi:hypothetical protein
MPNFLQSYLKVPSSLQKVEVDSMGLTDFSNAFTVDSEKETVPNSSEMVEEFLEAFEVSVKVLTFAVEDSFPKPI